MSALLRKYWVHPLARDVDIDSADTISLHREIILSKPILRSIYKKWYGKFLPSVKATRHLNLPMIEVGCGASHLERYIPDVIKTDVVPHANIDQVVDANQLPFADNSLRCIFVLNAFHHFDSPEKFLAEAERCLAVGGRLVVTEPTNSVLQKFMIHKFHPTEYYDEKVADWVNYKEGRLSQANNALPWIVFERDRVKFESLFPRLKIISNRRHTLLFYFASGGMSYRTFLPSVFLPLLHVTELLNFLFPRLGTEMSIVIEKT
jgi:SAM-dependent methyltransferase